jgi:gliding motility-associated-like protein
MWRFLWIGAFVFANNCTAQTFTKVYAAGDYNLQFINITPSNGNDWYAAGLARNNTDYAAFVSKFDNSGNPLWSLKPEENRDSRALVTLNDGSVLFFNNNSGFQGYFDASMMHLGADGSFISETIWGKPDDQDDWYDAKKMPNGEIIAVGMSRESSSFSERLFLAKFSSTGQVLWEKTYNGGLIARFNEVLPLPSGDFYVIGQSFNTGIAVSLLGKFSSNGDLEWVKSYDYGTENSYFLTGQPLSDGSILMAAYQTTQGAGDPSLNLVNISSNGTVTSQKAYDSSYDLGPFKMGKLNEDTLLIIAVSSGQVFPVVDNDQVVLQVSPQGDLFGALGFGTDGQDLGGDAFFTGRQVVACGLTDTSTDGSARRAFISKSGISASCCEKDVSVIPISAPPLPIESTIPFLPSAVPTKQSHTITLSNFPLTSSVSCQNLESGTPLLSADTSICIGDTLRIGILTNVPADVLWNTGSSTPQIEVVAPGTYSVKLSGECGVANDTIEVIGIGNRVEAEVTPVVSVCPGARVTLSASGGTNYQWIDAQGMNVFNVANPSISPDQSTNYQVVVSDGQCRDTASVQVNVSDVSVVSAGSDVSIKLGAQVGLSASGAASYIWLPDTGLSCVDCPAPFANPSETTTYTVVGTDLNGCSSTSTITVNVLQPCPFYIPNVFKPESETGDRNDRFGVLGSVIDPQGFHLSVYSRWGELVFETQDPENQWNGLHNGRDAQAGVYVYQLEMNTCDGLIKTNGNITLVR